MKITQSYFYISSVYLNKSAIGDTILGPYIFFLITLFPQVRLPGRVSKIVASGRKGELKLLDLTIRIEL